VHARKVRFFGFSQIKIGKKLPSSNRCVSHPRQFNLAKPAHKPCQRLPWQAIGQQKIQILLIEQLMQAASNTHALSSKKMLGIEIQNERKIV
jgi:hypothetical protein